MTRHKECFGQFSTKGSCDICPAAQWCEDYTIRCDLEAMEEEEHWSWLYDQDFDEIERKWHERKTNESSRNPWRM